MLTKINIGRIKFKIIRLAQWGNLFQFPLVLLIFVQNYSIPEWVVAVASPFAFWLLYKFAALDATLILEQEQEVAWRVHPLKAQMERVEQDIREIKDILKEFGKNDN